MPAPAHRIERLNLEVDVAGLEAALRLRGRVEDLSCTLFPPVVERVLDAAVPDDLHVRLDRLDLDLGAVAAERLEQDVPALLERALAEAIADAVARARQAPTAEARALTAETAALEDLETYLVHGTGAEPLDPAASLRALIERQPEALTAMLRRRARDRHAIERLVLQAGAEDLRALLAMLAPADAAVILAYHADLQRLYVQSRAPAPPRPGLPRALWVLTLEFILRDPGSQSNRRAFLDYLLRGMAVAEGIAYPALLALLRDTLEQTRKHRPVTGSLPGVLNELFARLADEDRGRAGARGGDDSAADAETGAALLRQVRAAAGDPAALDALVRRMTAPAFARLIERLEPEHEARIQASLAGLADLHRQRALLPFSGTGFERELRGLTLRLLSRDGFDRSSWPRPLLRGLARAGGVSQAFLLESLAGAGPLPAALAELAADLPTVREADGLTALLSRLRRHAEDRSAVEALVHGLGATDFRHLVERLQPRHARALLADIADLGDVQRRLSLFAFSDAAFAAQLRRLALQALIAAPAPRFRRLAWLRQLLHGLADAAGMEFGRLLAALTGAGAHFPAGSALPPALARIAAGLASPARPPSLPADERALARRLAEAAATDQAALAGWLAGDPGLLLRVAAELDEAALAASLAAFGPARAAALSADLALLARRHDSEPLARLDGAGFRRLTWALAIAALARDGGRLDRAAIRRAVLAGIARHQGVAAREAGDWRRLAGDAATTEKMPPSDLLGLAEGFLRSGRPSGFGPRLPEAARRDPSGFAALLRRLTVAASGNPGVLIDRLLDWMLPDEVVAALLPASAGRAADWAAALADAPGGSLAAAWKQILGVALADGDVPAADAPPSPGQRYDRAALLRHWLDRGALPWWAPPETQIAALLDALAGRSLASLRALLGDPDPERVAARLGRAVGRMGAAKGRALLERLAPWAFAPSGPLAARSAGLAGQALDDLRIRAAAAAIAGAPLDLDRLARPLPPLPEAAPEPPPPPGPDDRAALFAWLRNPGTDAPPERLLRQLADLADRGDAGLDAILRDGLARAASRARWAAALPDEMLARIVHRIAPARARLLLDLAALLGAARRQAAPSGAAALWDAVLAVAADGDAAAPRAIAARLIAALAGAPDAAPDLRARAAAAARQGGQAHVMAVLQPLAAAEPPRPSAAAKRPEDEAPPPPEPGAVMYVANAGLVLFNPFLPRFFERLGVLSEGKDGVKRIAGVEAASRAVHLLQYLVDQSCDRREPELVLNKLLCGVPVAAPVARAIEPDRADLALCDELIGAAIGNWPAIRNTSPAGLRETFLQREGRLRRCDDRWTLEVERKTVDVLVDQIPWNIAVVYHRWMAEPVHVTW